MKITKSIGIYIYFVTWIIKTKVAQAAEMPTRELAGDLEFFFRRPCSEQEAIECGRFMFFFPKVMICHFDETSQKFSEICVLRLRAGFHLRRGDQCGNCPAVCPPADVFECDPLSCGARAHCDDSGSSCVCDEGYHGNGLQCSDNDECDSSNPTHNCNQDTEVCENFEGSFKCISHADKDVRDAFEAANPDISVDIFPQEVVDQILDDSPMVPGIASFLNAAYANESSLPLFEITEDALSDSFTVHGYYSPAEPDAAIPEDLIARLYDQKGLQASTSVDPTTGYFYLVATDTPYGVNPFIILFVSASYGGSIGRRRELSDDLVGPRICMCKNMKACGPAFTLTLTWDTPTSDVDLHVYEPGGAHVYFGNPLGTEGAFLDYDDTEGFGPEHYVSPETVFTGINYQVSIEMFSYDEDFDVSTNWTLQAHSFGDSLWSTTGRFHDGETPSESELIPWIFDEQPICDSDEVLCQSCGILHDDQGRRLAWLSKGCDNVKAPSSWKPATPSTNQLWIDEWYCHWHKYAINPWWIADLMNKFVACVRQDLTDQEKQDIINKLGPKRDLATAIEAGKAVKTYFSGDSSKVCQHHAIALESILEKMGYTATVEGAFSATNSPHTWTELQLNGERYIFDCYNKVYVHVDE